MGGYAFENYNRALEMLLSGDLSQKPDFEATEKSINDYNSFISSFLVKLSLEELAETDEKKLSSFYHVASDIERIGDHAENFLEEAEEMNENGVTFSDDAMDELKNMYAKVSFMFERSLHVFENRDENGLAEISALESEVDMLKRVLGNNHIMRLNSGNCSVECGTHFYAIISALERVADHLTNIAFSIKSPSGSQLEAMEKIAREHAKKRHGANKAENNP